MKRISSLNDLLVEELADLLSAEHQLAEALPKMAQASFSPALKLILEDHMKVTQKHVNRLQDIFNNIGQNPQGVTSRVMKGLLQEGEHVLRRHTENDGSRDTGIIDIVQRVEHFEIGGYVISREHASDLGHSKIVELLEESLNEEREMNAHLNELAQSLINVQAIDPPKSKDKDVARFIAEGNPNNQEPNGNG